MYDFNDKCVPIVYVATCQEILLPRNSWFTQRDGKDVTLQWTVNSPTDGEIKLINSDVYRKIGSDRELVARYSNGISQGISDNMVLLYFPDISLIVSPYNYTIDSGLYVMVANFTSNNQIFDDEISFELMSALNPQVSETGEIKLSFTYIFTCIKILYKEARLFTVTDRIVEWMDS